MRANPGIFRKVGSAYRAQDQFSILWIRRRGSAWLILWQSPNDGWRVLGRHSRLADAFADGNALLGVPSHA